MPKAVIGSEPGVLFCRCRFTSLDSIIFVGFGSCDGLGCGKSFEEGEGVGRPIRRWIRSWPLGGKRANGNEL